MPFTTICQLLPTPNIKILFSLTNNRNRFQCESVDIMDGIHFGEGNKLIKRKMKSSLMATLGMVLVCSMSRAQVVDTSATASVTVGAALSLALVTSPNWGTVTRPPTGSASYTLNYTTGATTNISGDGYALSNGAAGEFTLSGTANAAVTFSISIGAFSGVAPVTVVASHINGASASGTGVLSAGGTLALKLGGTLAVSSTATLGAQTATVTVTVDYQ